MTRRAMALVAGTLDVACLPNRSIRSARFTDGPGGPHATVRLDGRPTASDDLIVVSRADFDSGLLAAARAAGANVLKSRVINVSPLADGFQVDTTSQSWWTACLIGADGANSLVRRRLSQPFRRDQLSIATGYFVHGLTSDEIAIEFVSDPPGYLWSFPRPTHLATGICVQADAGVLTKTLRARVLDWLRSRGIARSGRFEPYAWPIPSLAAEDFKRLDVSGRGWCLVGDAAGLVDPITREGIYFALLSGQRAAEAIATDFPHAGSCYGDRVREEIGTELARAARFKAGFFHPRFAQLMIRALRLSPAIREVMTDLIAGRQPYAGLRWRIMKTLEAGNRLHAFVGLRRRF